jgi:hypothetical protein
MAQHGRGDTRHFQAEGHLVGRDFEISAATDDIVGGQHQEDTHSQSVAVAGNDDRIRIGKDTSGQGVARAQHAQRVHAATFHHVEIETGRKDGFAAGDDHDGTIGFGPIECSIDRPKDLRRQRVAFAVVDAKRGDSALQTVLDGFGRHVSWSRW